MRLLAEDRLNIKSAYALREYVRKNGYNFAEDFIKNLHELFESLVVVQDATDLNLIRNIAVSYKLLPNDALISATCKYHGIRKIATFDDDFKRVDFLEVVEI